MKMWLLDQLLNDIRHENTSYASDLTRAYTLATLSSTFILQTSIRIRERRVVEELRVRKCLHALHQGRAIRGIR